MVWTGLAMSPAMTSIVPFIVRALGGHQSARTLHFVTALAVVAFAIGHVVMVAVAGFVPTVAGMITGDRPGQREHA